MSEKWPARVRDIISEYRGRCNVVGEYLALKELAIAFAKAEESATPPAPADGLREAAESILRAFKDGGYYSEGHRLRDFANLEKALTAPTAQGSPGVDWRAMKDAPKNASWVTVLMSDGKVQEAHWASDLSGEDQPAFQGWFVRGSEGGCFLPIPDPIAWKPETPEPPQGEAGA